MHKPIRIISETLKALYFLLYNREFEMREIQSHLKSSYLELMETMENFGEVGGLDDDRDIDSIG